MATISKRIIRAKAEFGNRFASSGLIDVRNASSIEIIRGNGTDFQIGIFDAIDDSVAVISDLASLNLRIRASQTSGSTILADKTVAAASFDETLTTGTWDDGTKQHAVFSFSNAEMNIDPEGKSKVLWLVLTGISDAGDEVTLAAGTITLHEDNNVDADPPPENPGTTLTLEEGDARWVQYISNATPPADAPYNLMSVYIDTASGIMYRAKGIATVADWVPFMTTSGEHIFYNSTKAVYQKAILSGPAGLEALTYIDL